MYNLSFGSKFKRDYKIIHCNFLLLIFKIKIEGFKYIEFQSVKILPNGINRIAF